jgi:hypothetical protein
VSLYGSVDTRQGSALENLIPSPGIPAWLLAIAGYLALMTVINQAPEFIGWLEGDLLKPEYMGYFLGTVTSLLSVVALLLFVFRSYTLCIYYLLIASIIDIGLAIAGIAGKTEDLNSYFYSLQGLDSVPSRIVGWTVGWNNVSDNIKQVVQVAGPVASLAACALLLYFHARRTTTVQR